MLKFYKYHGAGNDLIIIDNMNGKLVLSKKQVVLLCDRHKGIGADGLILVESRKNADCFMNYYDSDGSIKEMCGNGIRCVAKFFTEQKNFSMEELLVATRAGVKKVICNDDGSFSVNMGTPVFSHNDFPNGPLTLENISFDFASMGNPHAVGIVKDLNQISLLEIGPKVENDPHFPNKINVELIEKITDNYFKVKVWERGGFPTLACGSGACAIYATLKKENEDMKEVTLEFPGGNLYLSANQEGEIILRGPAVCIFEGTINL